MNRVSFFVFYSKKCKYSYQLCKTIEEEHFLDRCKLISLEDNKSIFDKHNIKHVPVIITKNIKPIYGDDAINFIKNLKFYDQNTNNIRDVNNVTATKYNDPKIKSVFSDLEFNEKEAKQISDNYTNIDDIDIKKLLMDVNEINKQQCSTKIINDTKIKNDELSNKLNYTLTQRKNLLLNKFKNLTNVSSK